jgi:hypothetical protein
MRLLGDASSEGTETGSAQWHSGPRAILLLSPCVGVCARAELVLGKVMGE